VSTLRGFGRAWDRITIYLPIILMALMAAGTYWLARNTPALAPVVEQRAPTHDADYYLRRFSIKSFDPAGRLKNEIDGAEARHFPDTDTTEIDLPRVRSYDAQGALTVATAKRGISNGDASQVQLIGDAVVARDGTAAGPGAQPHLEIRGDFLQFFMDTERISSTKPVTIKRGNDVFQADSMEYDNLGRVLDLRGRVRGVLQGAGQRP
jgi:lipopolysaccharide export system protein LptC